MNIPDIINGLFELSGSIFITMSIIKTKKDRGTTGVSWMTIAYFSSWGYWNLYYYPHLGQWWSFVGGILIVAANTIWAGQIIYYKFIQKPGKQPWAFVPKPFAAMEAITPVKKGRKK